MAVQLGLNLRNGGKNGEGSNGDDAGETVAATALTAIVRSVP